MILQLLFLYKMTLRSIPEFTMTATKYYRKYLKKLFGQYWLLCSEPKVFNLIKSNENISFVDLINKALAKG